MKQTIDLHSFRRAFEVYGRTDFSYGGLDYLANNTSVCGATDTHVVYQSF